ncbi:hypothetical protein JW824_05410 [bacterium]|nr:hypothetical protein [bacterium]RQV96314.1 MAG: hypothetical protein EH221_04915 [bacterium]
MELFAFAMKMEKDGETFYRELSNKADHEGQMKDHKQDLSFIGKEVDLYQKAKPDTWLENAEWYHLDAY